MLFSVRKEQGMLEIQTLEGVLVGTADLVEMSNVTFEGELAVGRIDASWGLAIHDPYDDIPAYLRSQLGTNKLFGKRKSHSAISLGNQWVNKKDGRCMSHMKPGPSITLDPSGPIYSRGYLLETQRTDPLRGRSSDDAARSSGGEFRTTLPA